MMFVYFRPPPAQVWAWPGGGGGAAGGEGEEAGGQVHGQDGHAALLLPPGVLPARLLPRLTAHGSHAGPGRLQSLAVFVVVFVSFCFGFTVCVCVCVRVCVFQS